MAEKTKGVRHFQPLWIFKNMCCWFLSTLELCHSLDFESENENVPYLGWWQSWPRPVLEEPSFVGTEGYTCWWKSAFPFIIIITIYGVQCASQALYKHYCRSLKSNCKVNIGASQVVLVVKNLSANTGDVRDTGLTPGSGRCPGVGNGNPFQYSCLENPMDRGLWWAIAHRLQGVGHDWSDLAWHGTRLALLYRLGNWGSEKFSDLPTMTQLRNGRACTWNPRPFHIKAFLTNVL